MAARAGELSTAKTLLEGTTDASSSHVNKLDNHGFTPLYHASMFGHTAVIELLVKGGADIHTPDLGLLTPLHIACEKNRPAAVKLLLVLGADINAVDSIGRTPETWAIEKGHGDVLLVLKEWKAGLHA